MIQERRVESIRPQVVFKPIRQDGQFRFKVIVTDLATCLLPDLFLGVEVGCSRREFDDLQAGIGGEQFSHRWAAMPLGSIPEHNDMAEREGLQMNCRWTVVVWELKFSVRVTNSSPVRRFRVP
jgi:hypothetical protein